MHYRPLQSLGVSVSEVGMGCNRLGEEEMPDSHWIDLVRQAADRGVTLFDSSESYNGGRSEEILGQALGNRDDVLVATKVSRVQETNTKDFSADRVIRQADESLRRLRRECIDIYQLHSPSLDDLQKYDWPEAMTKLREQGKIRAIGVSINDAASGEWLLRHGLAQVFQVPYNFLEPVIGEQIFPQAAAKGVDIMVRVPMAQGILTGKFRPDGDVAEGHRAHRAGQKMVRLIQEVEHYREVAAQTGLPMNQFALRYAISPDAVSCVIPGARAVEQVEQNVAASNGSGLPADVLAEMAEIRQRLAVQ